MLIGKIIIIPDGFTNSQTTASETGSRHDTHSSNGIFTAPFDWSCIFYHKTELWKNCNLLHNFKNFVQVYVENLLKVCGKIVRSAKSAEQKCKICRADVQNLPSRSAKFALLYIIQINTEWASRIFFQKLIIIFLFFYPQRATKKILLTGKQKKSEIGRAHV